MQRFAVVSLLALGLSGCNQSAPKPDVNQQVIIGGEETTTAAFNLEGLPTVTFDVPDMHCEVMCVPKVKKTLAEQPGVVDVQVDLDSKTATVAVKQDVFDAGDAVDALKGQEFPETAVHQPEEGSVGNG